MNHGELTNDPHQRLVEVLLEQEFAATRAVAPSSPVRSSSRWLAAALVVLGVGAVLGTMTLRRGGEPAMVPMQDPQPAPKEPVIKAEFSNPVRTYEEFLGRAKNAERVHMTVGGTLSNATLVGHEQVGNFLSSLPAGCKPLASSEPSNAPTAALRVTFRLGGNTTTSLWAVLDGNPAFWVGDHIGPFEMPASLQQSLNTLYAEALTNGRIAQGIAYTLEELARVPATATAIQCPPLPPGEVSKHLGRFAKLKRVDQVIAHSLGSGAPISIEIRSPARLAEFAVLPHLQHLGMSGTAFSDLDAQDITRLPALQSLSFRGGLGELHEPSMQLLVRKLDAIELISVQQGPELLRAVIAAGRIRSVALFGVKPSPEDFAALAAMPTLRDLDLTGIWWTDAHLAQLVQAHTRLERLRLQSTEVTPAGLCSLAALPELRELDLRREMVKAADLDAIAKALPNCKIRHPGEPWDTPPSGTRR